MAQVEFWQGNKAIAMGAIAAGCRFFGGYPITPSTEIMEVMSEELPRLGGKFVQMEDEIANGKEIHKSEAADVSFLVFITSVTKIRGRHLKNGWEPIVFLISDLDSCSGVEYHFLTRKRMKKILKGRKVLLNQKVLAHHEYRNFR